MSSSPLIFMAADETKPHEATAGGGGVGAKAGGPEAAAPRTRGRKPSNKSANGKKQPQRGLGVAQLERLRLEERWKKITEMPPQLQLQTLNFAGADPFHFPASGAGVAAEPLESVPVQYGAVGYGAHHRLMVVHQQQNRMAYPHGGGEFGFGTHYHHGANNMGSSSAGHHHAVMNMMPDQGNPMVHPQYSYNGFRVETSSKELSSIPKPHSQYLVPSQYHGSLDLCTFKKKRVSDEIMNGGMREKGPETTQMSGLMNLFGGGLNTENYVNMSNSAGEYLSLGFGPKATRTSSGHIPQNIHDEGLEVVGVHWKEDPGHVGGEVMAYEFFPGNKNDAGSSSSAEGSGSKEILQIMPREASYYYANANTSSSTTSHEADTSNSVDLSLKL